jgi:hypothetical protein
VRAYCAFKGYNFITEPNRQFDVARWGKGLAGPQKSGAAMSSDDYRPDKDATQAVQWAVKWRDLAEEALAMAETLGTPEARRHMLFIAEAYRRLADRANERGERLLSLAAKD